VFDIQKEVERLGIETVRFVFADLHGVLRGKAIAAAELGAALERGALVDVALVGDLVGVQRRRRGLQHHPFHPRRGGRVGAVVGDEALAQELGERAREGHALLRPAVHADDGLEAARRRLAAAPHDAERDAVVPSPLMPHLMFEWLLQRARERWPHRRVESRALRREPSMPWQQAAPDGTHYVSFAEWVCPINCIEPPLCPEIRGPRTWSMPPAVRAYVAAERARGHDLAGPVVFHCRHRAYGVGMFDTRDVLAGDRLVAASGAERATDVLVGTVSHCHGALSILAVGAPVTDTRSPRGPALATSTRTA